MGETYKYAGKNPQSHRKPGFDTQFTPLQLLCRRHHICTRYKKRPLLQFLSFMYFAWKL